jgi:hypothetical protein
MYYERASLVFEFICNLSFQKCSPLDHDCQTLPNHKLKVTTDNKAVLLETKSAVNRCYQKRT